MNIKESEKLKTSNGDSLFKYQDEEFVALEKDDGDTLVLSSLDALSVGNGGVLDEDYSSKKYMRIYAERMVFSGDYKVQNSVISAYNIEVSKDSYINTSGIDGKAPDPLIIKPDADLNGTPGGKGGINNLYIEDFSQPFPMTISSAGGKGGNAGGDPMFPIGGNGGNGGDGGSVNIVILNKYNQASSILKEAYQAPLSNALIRTDAFGRLSNIGEKFIDSILLDNLKKLCDKMKVSVESDKIKDILDKITDEVFSMDETELEKTVAMFNDTIMDMEMDIAPLGKLMDSNLINSNTDVSGGRGGTYGEGQKSGQRGIDGQNGTADILAYISPVEALSGAKDKFPIFHPDQCSMLLQKAKMFYFSSDAVLNPDGFTDATILFRRLYGRTEAFSSKEHEDLKEFYEKNEDILGTFDSVATFKEVFNEAKTYLNQMQKGLDYYGYSSNYVPLASFSFYSEIVDKLLNNLEKIESSYKDYFQNLKDQTKALDAFKNTRNDSKRIIQESEYKKGILISMAKTTATAIDAYADKMAKQKKVFLNEIEDFRDKIQSASGFNLDDLFSAVSMCAFCPESGFMAATQAGQLIYNSTEKINCGPGGQSVDKKYLVSRFKAIEADYQNLSEGYNQLADDHLQAEDINANKLLVQKQNLESFLDDFYAKFPDDVKHLKDSFDQYFNIVIERNNKIIVYNSIVDTVVDCENKIESNQNKIQVLNDDKLKSIKPDLPIMVNFVSKIYHEARGQVMEELYMASKAYKFWALSDSNFLAEALGGAGISTIDSSMLRGVQSVIIKGYQNTVEAKGREAQHFPANPQDKGLEFVFSQNMGSSYIESLKKNNEIYFKIKKVGPRTSKEESPFAGLAEVRLLKIRVWLVGAKSTDNTIQVDIINEGSEDIVNRKGMTYSFTHDPVVTKFIYSSENNADKIIEDGDVGMKDDDSLYAQIGPFANWRLKVDARYNKGLDLSELSDVRIEFHGMNYSFDC